MIYLEMKRRLFESWVSQVHNNCFCYHQTTSVLSCKVKCNSMKGWEVLVPIVCEKLTTIGPPPPFSKIFWPAPVFSCYTAWHREGDMQLDRNVAEGLGGNKGEGLYSINFWGVVVLLCCDPVTLAWLYQIVNRCVKQNNINQKVPSSDNRPFHGLWHHLGLGGNHS